MPPRLVQGLSLEQASHLCMSRCGGMCCRGNLILVLGAGEINRFQRLAAELGIDTQVETRPGGEGWVRFARHPGEHCPMLENDTSACRIYEERPQRCRDFPETVVAGCIISGG